MDERITIQNFYDFASQQTGTYNYDHVGECGFSQFLKSLGFDDAVSSVNSFYYYNSDVGYTYIDAFEGELASLPKILAGRFMNEEGDTLYDLLEESGFVDDKDGGRIYNAQVSWEEVAAAVQVALEKNLETV